MTENKRFKIYSDYDDGSIIDTTGEYVAEDYLKWMSEKQVCNLLNEQEEQLKPFTNLAKDYHLTLNQLFGVCSECIDKLDSIYEQKELLSLQEMNIKRLKERVNELEKENEKLKGYNKSQELEIVRLHKLADAMSGVLKELGVYDVYDEEQINSVKEKLK